MKLSEDQRRNQYVFGDGLTSIKKFKETPLDDREMITVWRRAADIGWSYERCVLKHPNCTQFIFDHYLKSSVWYHRAVAMFVVKNREKHIEAGLFDPSSNVRHIALNVAFQENHPDAEMYLRDNLVDKERFKSFLKEKKNLLKKKNLPLALTSPYSLIRREATKKWQA